LRRQPARRSPDRRVAAVADFSVDATVSDRSKCVCIVFPLTLSISIYIDAKERRDIWRSSDVMFAELFSGFVTPIVSDVISFLEFTFLGGEVLHCTLADVRIAGRFHFKKVHMV
jgi:hypothetical protein